MFLVAFTADKKIFMDIVDTGTTVGADRYEFVQKNGERWRNLKSRPTHLSFCGGSMISPAVMFQQKLQIFWSKERFSY